MPRLPSLRALGALALVGVATCAGAAHGARYTADLAGTATPTAWIASHPALTGDARPGATVYVTARDQLPGGGQAVRAQQRVDDIPVLGAETVVLSDRAGNARFAAGERLGGATPRPPAK